MSTMTTLEERVAALEGSVDRLEAVVDQGTDAGRYTVAVEELMAKENISAEEAVKRFNALLDSLPK